MEKVIHSPATPSSDPPFLFCRCRYLFCFLSEGRSMGWFHYSVQAGGATSPLAYVCPGLGNGRRRPLPPPPLPSYPRMNFMYHAVSACSPPGGCGMWYPAFPHIELHIPLMWYKGQESLDASQGGGGRFNPRPDARLRTSRMGTALSLSSLHLVLS